MTTIQTVQEQPTEHEAADGAGSDPRSRRYEPNCMNSEPRSAPCCSITPNAWPAPKP